MSDSLRLTLRIKTELLEKIDTLSGELAGHFPVDLTRQDVLTLILRKGVERGLADLVGGSGRKATKPATPRKPPAPVSADKGDKGDSTAMVVRQPSDVDLVFACYHGYHPLARLAQKSIDLIKARLKEGRSVGELCLAIDGNHKSPFHCGENPDGAKWQSLELILRNSDQVQKFMEIGLRPVERPVSAEVRRMDRACEDWAEKKKREMAGETVVATPINTQLNLGDMPNG